MQCFESGQVLVLPTEGTFVSREGRTQLRVLYSIEDILRHYDLKIDDVLEQFGAIPFVAQVPEGQELEHAEIYRHLPGVKAAIPNFHVSTQGKANKLEIEINQQRIDQAIAALNAEPRGDSCGREVKIAIIDTGIEPSLLANSGRVEPRQFATDSPDPAGTAPYDNVGHGTTVAYVVNQIAPAASILSVKMMDHVGNVGGLIAAIFVAEAEFKPDIYNLSLAIDCDLDNCGSCGNPIGPAAPVNANQLSLLFGLLDKREIHLHDKPLLVAAAGNGSKSILMPANFPNALAVGSYDPDTSTIPSYSRYNKINQDRFILAPGGLKDRLKAFGYAEGNTFFREGQLFFGTSFSAAFVTGVAARYLCAVKGGPCGLGSLSPDITTREYVMQCLSRSADRLFSGYTRQSHGLGVVRYGW
jgi:subtilisin family serine protease